MAAIITDILKKQMVQNIFEEATGTSNNYYIGIGKSSQWNATEAVPTPTDTPKTLRDARTAIQSIKKVEGVSYVIPRHNWSSGTTYSAYDDDVTSVPTNSYYVITDENSVYICLQQGRDGTGTAVASTVKPAVTDVTKPFKTADGYKWKFLYALSAAKASKFLSSNFMPVEKVLCDSAGQSAANGSSPGSLTATEIQQKQVDSNATPGQIVGISITNGGTGYSTGSPPAVTILGDGDSCTATAVVSGSTVVKIELDSSADSCMNMGHGYNFASVSIAAPSSGTTATARAIIGPDSGMGGDPRDELKATSLMFNIKPEGEVANGTLSRKTFLIGQPVPTPTTNQNFRQVSLIRNPKYAQNSINPDDDSASPPLFTAASGLFLQHLILTDSTETNSFAIDKVITGGTSGAKAIIDAVDATTGFHPRLIVHQDSETTGFGRFQGGEALTGTGGGSGTLADSANGFGFKVGDVDKTSGELLYIENRAPVDRGKDQTEDIKVVITL